MELDQIFRLAKDSEIEAVDLKLCNLFGGFHHITLPVERLKEDLFKTGVGLDSSSIPGFKTEGSSDKMLIPDPATAVQDPFWDRKTLSFLCSVYEDDTGEPFALDPRQILIRAEKHLLKSGIADRSLWGPEFEFNIFDAVYITNSINEAYYRIESSEAGWRNADFDDDDDSCLIHLKGGYHAAPPCDRYYNLRDQMSRIIKEFGIPVKYHHHEVGGSGQSEIEIELLPALSAGDAVMTVKYICKNLARQNGCCATFMPKPLFNEAGNGMHFHQHLFKKDDPLFFDEIGYHGLSQLALYYIGGLLKHGPALLALTNPTTNSYKRLLPGFEAPVKAIFGPGNRSAAVRIPKYAKAPHKKRIEFRPPDATCNPYIAIAAQLMAGIDGIRNEIDPGNNGFGPYDIDVSKLPVEKQADIPSLPTSLSEAVSALKTDHDFLLEGEVFSEQFISNWTSKLEKESAEVNNRPHPSELSLYFNV